MSAAEVLPVDEESALSNETAGDLVAPLEPQPLRWTREQFHRLAESGIMGEDPRLELIDGEIFQMSPMDPPYANTIRGVERVLERYFGSGLVVSKQLPLDLGVASEPYPDLAVSEGSLEDFDSRHPDSAVLVVEVSDSSLRADQVRKAALYARAGIPEYWIVDLAHQRLEVRRDPAPISGRLFEHGYKMSRVCAPGEAIAPLAAPHAEIPVEALLPPAPRNEPS